MFDEDILIPSLAIISFFGTFIILIYLFFNTRYKVRMALIEHDKTANIFARYDDRPGALKHGLVAIMVGVGLIMGSFLARTGMEEFVAYVSMVSIMGGIALVIYYRWSAKSDDLEIT